MSLKVVIKTNVDKDVLVKVFALIKKASAIEKNQKVTTFHNRSSLQQVVKTKEQANTFMKLLKSS